MTQPTPKPHFRNIVGLCLAALALLVACVPPPTPPDAGTGETVHEATGTLQGHVSIGPLQPVARADEPTPVVPPEVYAARQIVVTNADDQADSYRVPIGPDGTYQVALAPGSYLVDFNRVGIDFSKDLPATAEIAAGQTITLNVIIDTGIR